MDGNGAQSSGNSSRQSYKPLQPRPLAPAPSSTPSNHALLPTFASQHSPQPWYPLPQYNNQAPRQAHNVAPHHLPFAPTIASTTSNNGLHQSQDQNVSQASPGGPYRPVPSLANEQPLRHTVPYLGSPYQNLKPQSPEASGTDQGDWYQNISQTAYNPDIRSQGGHSAWVEAHTDNPHLQNLQSLQSGPSPQHGKIQLTGDDRAGLDPKAASQAQGPAPVKKPRKPRVSKKKQDSQQSVAEPTSNGQDHADSQNPQEKPVPVKKTRKPRGPNKAKLPQTTPKHIQPKVSETTHPQGLLGTVDFENASAASRSEIREGLEGSQLDSSTRRKVSENDLIPAPISTTEFEAISATRRLESREELKGRDYENSSRKISINGFDTPLTTTESEPTPAVDPLQRTGWPLAEISDEENDEDEDDDDDPGSDEESGEDNEYGKIMSQVSRYKGGLLKAMGGRRQENAAGLGLLNGLASIEPEDAEEERELTPKDPNRLRKVKHRGPHAAAEVTGEIKLRLGQANEAFAESKIDKAKALVDEIIRINAETYEAWNLLSSIFQEQNLRKDALMALIVAAHLRPKHIDAWFNAAEYALTSMGPLTPKLLGDAQFCYSSAIRQVPTSLVARRRKVEVLLLRQNYNLAARDLAYLLRTVPHDLELIRELAMVYVDLGDGKAGVELYKKAIEHYRKVPDDFDFSIDWNDLHSCAVLYSLISREEDALKDMKAFARWLLGREDEIFWDDITENDCEWDVDDSRRSKYIEKYEAGLHPISAYGKGLPIELRVYFGKYRLRLKHHEEAMRHFQFLLEKSDEALENMVKSHSHLVADVAKSLYEADQHKDCLMFYGALKQLPNEMTAEGYLQMGKCFLYDDRANEAEAAFKEACNIDKTNIEARIQLARMYERMDESERAFIYVNQVIELESIKQPKMYHRQRGPALIEPQPGKTLLPGPARALRRKKARELRDIQRANFAAELRDRYLELRKETDGMRAGKHRATDAWMDAARALTEDFRSCRAFYPWDRKEFDGYTKDEAHKAQLVLKRDLQVLHQEHVEDLGPGVLGNTNGVPNCYRGINFKDWIDIFCEYAMCLAKRGRSREAYDIVEAGIHAMCFMFNKEDMFMLHICYCICALIGNDEETCVGMARWFMVRYQFCTDSYRMFAALLRMCHSPISWYSSGPTQKFILRQIKTMDWVLSNEKRRSVIKGDKANYTQMDEAGKPIVNQELDVSLLMAYGHILVAGSSYVYALNYFHRALSVDPQNPMIILSLGLSYIQYGLKRQVDNRQYVITQGLMFMHQYYNMREKSGHFEERQEAHYNMARTYHLLGLTNLAIPFYRKVLQGADDEENLRGVNEDWCLDAAYNLQTIYTTAGNMELAQSLTRKWLVI